MALIANGGGGRRTPRVPAGAYDYYIPGVSPWSMEARGPTRPTSAYGRIAAGERVPSEQASWPLWRRGRWPGWFQEATRPLGPSAEQEAAMRKIGMGKENVVINVGGEQPQQYANWWERPGAMQPSTPEVPGATPITPTPWEHTWSPFFEAGGAPQDWLRLTAQDWWAIPEEVRGELERWLRSMGWRPGGRYGRYGALGWGRAAGAEPWTTGRYIGEQQFAGIPERMKSWIWWLSKMKGWAPGREAAEMPATAGWSW